ncbi:hypothetical protein ACFFX0_07700 [Citricoccus parietis]|uniref:Uncharacterized protein n=1 Tax=Citricoccus parietis TaxID=592307 RepID=A0ABV5FWN5_9MICC
MRISMPVSFWSRGPVPTGSVVRRILVRQQTRGSPVAARWGRAHFGHGRNGQ